MNDCMFCEYTNLTASVCHNTYLVQVFLIPLYWPISDKSGHLLQYNLCFMFVFIVTN